MNYESGKEEVATSKGVMRKAEKPYDSKLLGIISTNPGVIMGSIDGEGKEDKRMLALSGRVPVKIDPDSEPIEVGDFLTSSDKPGLAMKATKAGYTVGKALEAWQPASAQGSGVASRIEVFVNLGYYVGSLTADGYINTQQKFIAQDVKVDMLAETYKRLVNELNLPLPEGSDPLTLTEGSDPSLAADTISASVAEVLSALAGKLDKADQRISTLEAGGLTLSGSYMNNEVNLGGGLISPLAATKLTLDVSTDTIQILGSTTIGGSLTIGLVTVDDLEASINSLGESLKLQSSAMSNLEIMGGKVTIDTKGNLKVAGEITAEKATVKELCVEDICVTRDQLKELLEKNEIY